MTLVLFIVLIEMLLPSGKMKKFISLVTGTVLVIAIINPLVELLGNGIELELFQTANSNYLDKLQVEKDSKLLEEKQMKQTVEVYRLKIIEQIEQSAMEVEGVKEAKADIIFNEDYNSKNFGEIKRVYLEINEKEEVGVEASSELNGGAKEDGSFVEIEPVQEVDTVRIGTKKREQGFKNSCSPEVKKQLTNKINQLYGIKSDDIIISKMMG